MLKADPSILRCTVRWLGWNVWRNCACKIGLIGASSGHLILVTRDRHAGGGGKADGQKGTIK